MMFDVPSDANEDEFMRELYQGNFALIISEVDFKEERKF